MLLTVDRISKEFNDRTVLSDVSFDMGEGEIVGFLGPNGSGKTTTIKIILGLLTPDSGNVYINGLNIRTDFEKAVSGVGAIIETPELYGFLSGFENLRIAGRPYGVTRARIDEVVEAVGLQEFIGEKVRRYSLGMRQRLGIAQAMLHSPRLLILDEPLNGLDPAGVVDFRELLRELAKNGTSVLISSHQLAEMELICSRLIIIEGGFIVSIKTLKELTTESEDIPVNFRLDVNDAAAALRMLTEHGFSAAVKESGLVVCMTRIQSAEAARLLVENGISLYGMSAQKKTLSDAFMEATGKKKRRPSGR